MWVFGPNEGTYLGLPVKRIAVPMRTENVLVKAVFQSRARYLLIERHVDGASTRRPPCAVAKVPFTGA